MPQRKLPLLLVYFLFATIDCSAGGFAFCAALENSCRFMAQPIAKSISIRIRPGRALQLQVPFPLTPAQLGRLSEFELMVPVGVRCGSRGRQADREGEAVASGVAAGAAERTAGAAAGAGQLMDRQCNAKTMATTRVTGQTGSGRGRGWGRGGGRQEQGAVASSWD